MPTSRKLSLKTFDSEVVTSWQSATDEFKAAHPEWVATPLNEKLMGYKIAELNLGRKPSLQTLEKVFDACKGDGLLQTEAIEGKTEEKTEERKEPVKKKATGSSIFGSGQTGASRSRSADSTGKFEAEVQKLQNRLEKGEIDARLRAATRSRGGPSAPKALLPRRAFQQFIRCASFGG